MFVERSLFVAFLAALSLKGTLSQWSYSSQSTWSSLPDSATCDADGTQSPINLLSSSTKRSYSSFNFAQYANTPTGQTLRNDGHTARVEFADNHPQISGGGLSGTYQFLQYHVHWGSTDAAGSEHTIDGTQRAFELHLVHWKTSYGEPAVAITKSDGLAVLGILYNVGAENTVLKPITDQLPNIVTAADSVNPTDLPLLRDILPSNTAEFYRYKGSLTTPTCNDAVIWTVFKQELQISAAQIAAFRTLTDSSSAALTTTFRDVQPLGNRPMYCSKSTSTTSTITKPSSLTGPNGGTSSAAQALNMAAQNFFNFWNAFG